MEGTAHICSVGTGQIIWCLIIVCSTLDLLAIKHVSRARGSRTDAETIILDLDKDFSLDSLQFMSDIKPAFVPIVAAGYMWMDDTGDHIFIAGGVFAPDGEWYNSSTHYLRKEDIPNYSLWRYTISSGQWDEIKPSGDSLIRRAISAYTSVPAYNKSFAFG